MGYYMQQIKIKITSIMTTLVHTDSRDYQASTGRTLVSTGPFDAEFYSYTVSKNPATGVTSGVFSVVSGATPTTCPRGRILHLTGRKLFPDVNPMTTFVGTALTAKKFLVAVYDPISFLNGFIDPTSNTFAKFDQNVPNFFDLGTSGSGVEWSGGGQGVDIHLVDSGTIAAVNVGSTVAAKNASTGNFGSNNGTGAITVTTTACTSSSRVFLTQTTGTATTAVVVAAAGSFTATLGGISTWNFLIVN
jgi:hypothetical protein